MTRGRLHLRSELATTVEVEEHSRKCRNALGMLMGERTDVEFGCLLRGEGGILRLRGLV